MRSLLAALLLTFVTSSAHAGGGMNCEARNKSVRLQVEAGISRGLGASFFSFKGELDILVPGAPKDFRKVTFGRDHLTHHWLDGRNLKLRIYRERPDEPHGSVEIVIEAWPRKDEAFDYRGGYALTIFDSATAGAEGKMTTLKVRITCSAE